MAELKTKPTNASVPAFLRAIPNAQIREDSATVITIMSAATKAKPRMWGSNIVGFGSLRYVYASGREGDWPLAAFAPRKDKITLYILGNFEQCDPLLAKLGKHARGGSCLHIRKLSDVHLPTLKKLVAASVRHDIKTRSVR